MDEEFDYEALGLTPVVVGGNPTTEPAVDEKDPQDDYYEALTAEQRAEFDGMSPDSQDLYRNAGLQVVTSNTENANTTDEAVQRDPELQALLARQPQIRITGEAIDDPRVPIGGGTGAIGYNVTDQVREAAKERGPRDYEYFYGTGPETASLSTRVGAFLNDISDVLTPGEQEPSKLQLDRDNFAAMGDAFVADMQELYDNAPTAGDMGLDIPKFFGGEEVRVQPRLTTNAEGEIDIEYVRIPAPDSSAFEQVIDEAGRSIFQQLGALVTEGVVTGESALEARVPDFEMQGMEALITDIVTYGAPSILAERTGRAVGGGLATLSRINTASKGYRTATLLGGSLGVALSDAVLSDDSQDGMIVRPEFVTTVFKIDDPERAADVAMFMDGMILNGVFDGILLVAGKGVNMIRDTGGGVRGFFDAAYVENKASRQSLLAAVTIMDPALEGATSRQLTRNLYELAKVMDANASIMIKVGETTGEIPLDTVNALANGAEKYITVTRANLRRTMTDPEWDEYVRSEGAAMVERTIGLARSQDGNPILRTAQANMAGAVDRTLSNEAERLLPTRGDGSDALADGTQALIDQRRVDINVATTGADGADQTVAALTAARNTAVESDPFIRELIASDDPIRFFNNSDDVAKLREVLGDNLFREYSSAWEGVNKAYADIPNVGIDTEEFIDQVNRVVQEANVIDGTGAQAKRILGRIYSGVQPGAVDGVIETAEELLERLDGKIGFQDLYRARQQISNMIGETSDPAIAQRLKELKSHITDPENGQLGAVIRSGDQEAADAALAADRMYIDTMSRFQDSAPMRRFSDVASERRAGSSTPTAERFQPRGQSDLNATTVNQILPEVAGDVTGSQYQSLRQAFDDPELAATLDSAVANLYIGQGTRELANALRGAGKQSPEMIISAFEEQARMLRQTGNPIAGQLEEAALRIRRLQSDLGDDILVAEEAAKIARKQVTEAEDTIVQRFINRYRPQQATGSPQKTIFDMLGEADAGDSFQALFDQVRRINDPVQRASTEQALQGAVLRSLREKVFGSTPISSEAYDVRLGNLNAINRETSNNVLGGVRAAFPDSPEVVEGIELVLNSLHDTNIPARVRVARAGSDTAANSNIRDSVSAAVLFSLGYMNPTAAAARKLTAKQVQQMEELTRRTSVNTLSSVLAAPEEFSKLLKAIANRESPSILLVLRNEFQEVALESLRFNSQMVQEGVRFGLRVEPSELATNATTALEDAITRQEADYEVPEGFDE